MKSIQLRYQNEAHDVSFSELLVSRGELNTKLTKTKTLLEAVSTQLFPKSLASLEVVG